MAKLLLGAWLLAIKMIVAITQMAIRINRRYSNTGKRCQKTSLTFQITRLPSPWMVLWAVVIHRTAALNG